MEMNRRFAKMIAEELYKLMKGNLPVADEWLTRQEAADYLKVSVSYLSHHKHLYDSVVKNGKRMYNKRTLTNKMSE